jgi:hypothetical protein
MLVRSASDDRALKTAATDSRGDFGMSLPGEESSVLIEIDGKRSDAITRAFTGSSVVSTVVRRTDSGDLSTGGSFEVHIDPDTICGSVGSENNELFMQGDISSSCSVRIKLASSEYAFSTFSAVLLAKCGSDSIAVASSRSDSQGVISVDLYDASTRGCIPSEIQISSARDAARAVVVPIR